MVSVEVESDVVEDSVAVVEIAASEVLLLEGATRSSLSGSGVSSSGFGVSSSGFGASTGSLSMLVTGLLQNQEIASCVII